MIYGDMLIPTLTSESCIDITFCTGSGRRTTVAKFIKNSFGIVGPPVDTVDEEDLEDDDGVQVEREIWDVTHVCEQHYPQT